MCQSPRANLGNVTVPVERLGVPKTRIDDIAARMAAKKLAARMPDGSLIVTGTGRQEFEGMVAS